jgi:hypothetical protein
VFSVPVPDSVGSADPGQDGNSDPDPSRPKLYPGKFSCSNCMNVLCTRRGLRKQLWRFLIKIVVLNLIPDPDSLNPDPNQ